MDRVITKSSLLDPSSVIPTMFNMEMTEVNHAKFYPIGQTFIALGMYLGFRLSAMDKTGATNSNNAILRQLHIGFDRTALVGEYGNNGLLRVVNGDPLRVVNNSVELPKIDPGTAGNFSYRAKAVKNLGSDLKEQINETTASNSLTLVVYGSALQSYMTDTNAESAATTDATQLYDYLQAGFGKKFTDIIEVPQLVLTGSALENQSGIAVVSAEALTLDTVGFPDLDGAGTEDNEAGKFDWFRFSGGSCQFKPEMLGAIINQPLTIEV
jgi:ABC-type antimicrobial peptide transport system permease subunit